MQSSVTIMSSEVIIDQCTRLFLSFSLVKEIFFFLLIFFRETRGSSITWTLLLLACSTYKTKLKAKSVKNIILSMRWWVSESRRVEFEWEVVEQRQQQKKKKNVKSEARQIYVYIWDFWDIGKRQSRQYWACSFYFENVDYHYTHVSDFWRARLRLFSFCWPLSYSLETLGELYF